MTEADFTFQNKKTLISLMSTLIRCHNQINILKSSYHQSLINAGYSLRLIYEEKAWTFQALSNIIKDDQALDLLWLTIVSSEEDIDHQEDFLTFD